MNLSRVQQQKIDPLLRDALVRARPEDMLRVVMTLQPDAEQPLEADLKRELDPTQFHSREAYRRALIEQQKRRTLHEISRTIHELERLLTTVHGGEMSHTVVAEGSAQQVVSALSLTGVQRASLDRPLELVEPRPCR